MERKNYLYVSPSVEMLTVSLESPVLTGSKWIHDPLEDDSDVDYL